MSFVRKWSNVLFTHDTTEIAACIKGHIHRMQLSVLQMHYMCYMSTQLDAIPHLKNGIKSRISRIHNYSTDCIQVLTFWKQERLLHAHF